MSKCKCGSRTRLVSNVVQSMNGNNNTNCGGNNCMDVCTHPMCGDPNTLGIYAPLIYDEIGINLCATFASGATPDLATQYPTATSAQIKAVDVPITYGATGVQIEQIAGRPNCYSVTLRNLEFQFVMNLYDSNCRLLGTTYPTGTYLPQTTTPPTTYDEDTNPTSVELEIFAPYGVAYDTTTTPGTPTPILNFVGSGADNNQLRQGLNLFTMAKVLDVNIAENTVTVGLTLVLQSLYYVGYKVPSKGKIEIPKGSILSPENSDCMRFVAGDLLNLAIKPLDLGKPYYEEWMKNDCDKDKCVPCTGPGMQENDTEDMEVFISPPCLE